jgi:Tetratricopeptide repeat
MTFGGNLAGAYESAGRLDDAIRLFERTLADRERVLGGEHPHTLALRNNLAAARRRLHGQFHASGGSQD